MATEKVGIYRKYHGPVPTDSEGNPLPKAEWPRKRACRWCVRWFGTDGRRYSRSFDNLRAAERFKESQQSEVRKGKADLPQDITLHAFTQEHLTLIRDQIGYRSYRDHKRALERLQALIGDCLLRKITPKQAELYVKSRMEAKVSPSTVNKDITVLRRIFTLAIERRGYLPEGQNPFKKIEKRKVSANHIRYVRPEEFKSLIEACQSSKVKVLLSLLYTTGLRIDEARHLTWSDIDFERGELYVAAKRDPRRLVPWEPKDHDLRHIPLGKKIVDLLTQWQAEAPENVPYVFLTAQRYARVMDPTHKDRWRDGKSLINNLLREFKAICQRAGVVDCSFHDLRRTCLTNWARDLSAHVVRKLAGHASLETTMKYYLSVQEMDLAKARDVGDALLNRAAIKDYHRVLSDNLTDPKLTHSGQNESETGAGENGVSAEQIEN